MAEINGLEAASRHTGIAPSTIHGWMNRPEFVELRSKTREDLATDFRLLAHLMMSRLVDAVQRDALEPRDLIVGLGVATDKHLLMSGEATARSESKDISDDLPASAKRYLRDRFADLAGDSGDGVAPQGPQGAEATAD